MSVASRRRVALTAVAVMSTLVLAACGSSGSGAPEDTPSPDNSFGITLVQRGKLTVCTTLSHRPFQFKDDSGQVVGFDVDLLDLVAEKLGATQEVVDVDHARIVSGEAFRDRQCDAAAAATTITPERGEFVLFSDPYFDATQALLAAKDSGVKDLPDLLRKRLAVQSGTTGQAYAHEHQAANRYEVVVFDDTPTQLTSVLTGRADAVLNDNGVVLDFVKDNPTTEVVQQFDTEEQYGVMVRKDDANGTRIAGLVNVVVKDARADGRYAQIYRKWFGVDPPE